MESIADPLVVNGDKATSNTVNIGGPGSLLVDLIPGCRFFRLAVVIRLQLIVVGLSEALANLDAVLGLQEARSVYPGVSR